MNMHMLSHPSSLADLLMISLAFATSLALLIYRISDSTPFDFDLVMRLSIG